MAHSVYTNVGINAGELRFTQPQRLVHSSHDIVLSRASRYNEPLTDTGHAMTPIEHLQQNITTLYPAVGTSMTRPLDWGNGVWVLDLIHPDVWLIVEWSPVTSFGVSRYSDENGYGERPDHAFASMQEAQTFIDEVFKGATRA